MLLNCLKKLRSNDQLPGNLRKDLCFPLYFSKSPIDGSKQIVEHIEALNDREVKLYQQCQRAEYEMGEQLKRDMVKLREHQVQKI